MRNKAESCGGGRWRGVSGYIRAANFCDLNSFPSHHSRDETKELQPQRPPHSRHIFFRWLVVIDNSRNSLHVSQISQPQCSRCSAEAHRCSTTPAASSTSTYLTNSTSTSTTLSPPAHAAHLSPPSHLCRRSCAPSSPGYGGGCCCCHLQLAACPHYELGLDVAPTS